MNLTKHAGGQCNQALTVLRKETKYQHAELSSMKFCRYIHAATKYSISAAAMILCLASSVLAAADESPAENSEPSGKPSLLSLGGSKKALANTAGLTPD